jgi:transcriptional regulator with XRE-family HTH domain
MSWIGRLPLQAFHQATSTQYLAFLKVLGVEQRHIAQYLGVSPQLVSFWCRGDRPVSAKYRAPLRDWAQQQYLQALDRQQQEAAALPTAALRHAAEAAFDAPLMHWATEVFYTSGLAEQTLRATLRELRRYEDREPWTAADLREMERLCLLLDIRLRGFVERYAETLSAVPEAAEEAGD